MKKYLFMFLLCACAWGCAGCASSSGESEQEPAETAETEAVTTTVTTEATTTVTTTTTADYLAASDVKLEVRIDTVRPSKCTAVLKNTGETVHAYTPEFRIYQVSGETEKLCREQPDYEAAENPDSRNLAPDEEKELDLDWAKRYGDLQDGTYILEMQLEKVHADPEDPESPMLRLVARAEFQMDSAGFVPQFTIAPEDIHPEGIVLHIKNSPDAARSYGMVYHIYDESRDPHVELIREIDQQARLYNDYYIEPGAEMVRVYDWSSTFGSLVEGEYTLEIDLLTEGESEGKTYRIPFEIT